MAEEEVSSRIVSAELRIPVDNIETGDLTDPQWEAYTNLVAHGNKYTLNIDDNPRHTMQSIETDARAYKEQFGLDVLIIDYLQLISVKIEKGSNRERAVSEISVWAKTLARELKVILIMGCQLNRDLEKRQNKRPTLADLRESGSLEQDADCVIGLYRDDQYNPGTQDKNTMEWILLKNRGGAKGFAKVYYNAAVHCFGVLKNERLTHYDPQ
jgi:replicative DNA helicase